MKAIYKNMRSLRYFLVLWVTFEDVYTCVGDEEKSAKIINSVLFCKRPHHCER